MTDFRALCAELHAAFNTYAVDEAHHDLLVRAKAALAQPEPEGPSDEELLETAADAVGYEHVPTDETCLSLARAVLARWGQAQQNGEES
jgi:alkylhydroperoxidase/carboxymuconolactone decarboxylase family protein YurZ